MRINNKTKILFVFALLFGIFGFARSSLAANHYVSSGATGSATGADWTNAYTALPSTLVRGDIYYVAGGSYAPYDFTTPVDGTKVITVRKATASDHGTDTGWQSTFGTTAAVFTGTGAGYGVIQFMTSYIVFDGVTGGGPGSWDTGFGFVLTTPYNEILVMFSDKWGAPNDRVDVSNITFSHAELTINHPLTAGYGDGFNATACCNTNGQSAQVSNLTISYAYIHEIGGAPMYLQAISNAVIEYVYMHRNASAPTSHGAGIRIDSGSNITIRYSLFSDLVGTGFVGAYDHSITGFYVYGNVFYCTPGSTNCSAGDGIVYQNSQQVSGDTNVPTGWRIYNNSFVNLSIENGPIFNNGNKPPIDCIAYNNLFYGINISVDFPDGFSHDYNWFDISTNTYTSEPNAQDDASGVSPFVDWTTGDFSLKSPTNAAMTLPSPYNADMLGNTRGGDGVWDRGALEYGGNNTPPPPSDTTPPAVPTGIVIQ